MNIPQMTLLSPYVFGPILCYGWYPELSLESNCSHSSLESVLILVCSLQFLPQINCAKWSVSGTVKDEEGSKVVKSPASGVTS